MSISDDLARLADLHGRGALTDDEYARAKSRLLSGSGALEDRTLAAINGFRRSRENRWLGGVCGGLAQSSGLAAWFWRLLFVLLSLCAGGGVLLYLLAWILVPTDTPLGPAIDRSVA